MPEETVHGLVAVSISVRTSMSAGATPSVSATTCAQTVAVTLSLRRRRDAHADAAVRPDRARRALGIAPLGQARARSSAVWASVM